MFLGRNLTYCILLVTYCILLVRIRLMEDLDSNINYDVWYFSLTQKTPKTPMYNFSYKFLL